MAFGSERNPSPGARIAARKASAWTDAAYAIDPGALTILVVDDMEKHPAKARGVETIQRVHVRALRVAQPHHRFMREENCLRLVLSEGDILFRGLRPRQEREGQPPFLCPWRHGEG